MTDNVILLDVDNTLLDNDRVIADLRAYLQRVVGEERQRRYWTIFEELRATLGYTDYLGALQQYRREYPRDTHLLALSSFLIDYPFAARLFPDAAAVIQRCKQRAPTVLLTDGDVVFQPHKIERSGLFEAVDGQVLIYVHKEEELEDVAQRYRARHYTLVDDKLRILTAVKDTWGPRVTTVFPVQGSYAHDPAVRARYPAPDVTVPHIGALLQDDVLHRITRPA